MEDCGSSYWQTCQLTFDDGSSATVKLDVPTLQRLQSGDSKLMEEIKKNIALAQTDESDVDKSNSDLDISTASSVEAACTASSIVSETEPPKPGSSRIKTGQGQPKYWNKDETTRLVNLRFEMEPEFIGFKNHTTLWNKITEKVREEGILVTSVQCQNKFKQLKRDWRQVIDHNNRTGVEPKTCPYFNEFNEIYGCKSSTKPQYTYASCQETPEHAEPFDSPGDTRPKTSDEPSGKPSAETRPKTSDEPSGKPPIQKNKKLKKSHPESSPALEFLKQYDERQQKEKAHQLKAVKEMHDEKMTLMREFLDVMQTRNK